MVALTGFGFAEPEQKPDQVGMLCIAPIADRDKSGFRQSVINEEVGPKKPFRDYFPDTKNPAKEGFSKAVKTTTSIQPFVKFECKSSPVRSESVFLEANVSWEVKARSGWLVYSRDGVAKEEVLDQEAATVTRTVKAHLDQRTGKILLSVAANEDDDHWGSATFLKTTVENDPAEVKAMTSLRAQAIHPCKRVASYPFEVRFIKASEIAFDTNAEASENAIKMATILNDNGFEDSDYQAIQAAIDVNLRIMSKNRPDRVLEIKNFVHKLNQICSRWEFRE